MNLEEFKSGVITKIADNETKDTLNKVNEILFEELERLRNLDITHTQTAQNEISRSNAIANTSKTILQTTGIQLMLKR